MKKILAATLALSVFATAGVASAQTYGQRGDYGRYDQSRSYDGRADRYDSRNDRYDRSDRYDRDDRRDNRYEQRASRRYNAGRYQAPRGYAVRQWSYGQRMPSYYRSNQYVVSDYGRYGLRQPPRGYQYVRSGDDVVMTAIATGLITAVIAGLFN